MRLNFASRFRLAPTFRNSTGRLPRKTKVWPIWRRMVWLACRSWENVEHALTHRHFWRAFAASFLVLLVLGGGAVWVWQAEHRSPFDFFWGPVLNSTDSVLFCIADQKQYSSIALRDATDQSRQLILPDSLTAVVIDDLSPIVRAAGLSAVAWKEI